MFEFSVPSKIVFGEGLINSIGETVSEYGDKVFLVTDAVAMQETNYLTKIKKQLEEHCYGVLLFNRIYSHSQTDSNSDIVNKGADQAAHARCNVIVGFGGKTTLHVAKAIAFLVSNGGNLEDYFLGRKGDQKKVVYIEIPTGFSYMPGITNSFYILDRFDQTKKIIETEKNYCDLLLMDPKLTTTIPAKSSAPMGVELLSFAIDALISKKSNAIAESFAIKSIELLANNLIKSIQDPENVNFRGHIATAGILATLAAENSSAGLGFALSMALNSVYGVYQGVAASILLPHIMEFNLTSCANKYVHIAKAFGENIFDLTVVEAAIKAIEGVRKILTDLRIPVRLSEMNIDKDDFMHVAKMARSYDFMNYLPRPVSKEDLFNILNTAY